MKRSHFIFILYSFILTNLFAQNSGYKFRKINTNDGLSQSSVIKIQQDTLGQIWLATRDGLNMYDGSNFTIYRSNPNDSLSISNDDILAIKEDSEGTIWIGTYNGLNRYNPIEGTFKRYFHNKEGPSLTDNTIWAIEEINNEIWIGTSKGLSVFNKTEGVFVSILNDSENDFQNDYILSILHTNNNDIWVGTSKGLYKLISRNDTKFNFKRIKAADKGDATIFVQDIIEAEDQTLWIATKMSGLCKIDSQTDQLISLNTLDTFRNLDTDIRALSFDNQRNLWIGTYDGIYILEANGYLNNLTKSSNLNINKVKSIFTDKKGSVWIGTYYGGVAIWDETNANFTNFDQDFEQDVLNNKVIGSIVSDNQNNIYVGTEGGGITKMNENSRNISYINTANTPGLGSDNIKSMFLHKDQLWIGSFNSGLAVYNLQKRKIDQKWLPKQLHNLLNQSGLYTIKKDRLDNMWFGTFGNGLIRYHRKNKQLQQFRHLPNDLNTLSSNRIRTILLDTENNIWIGTQSGLNTFSLAELHKKKPDITRYFYNDESSSGVDILTIFEDSENTIWVGTKARGLFRFNGREFEKIAINEDATEIASVHAILQDDDQNLWLSSNRGIVKYNIQNTETKIYDQSDGLVSGAFNDNASLKLHKNRFYFGGPSGITYFDPSNILTNKYAPKVILTDLKIKNASVEANDATNILAKTITHTKKVKLSYNNANFSIHFAIPNFINASNNQYAYRMLGLDEQWTKTSSNQATYTIQQPGTYFFEVKGSNNDGLWNEEAARLEINVQPAPWRSWWAFALYALLIAFTLLFLIRFLKSKARLKHELELEHIEHVRNEETNKAKLQFFTNISHEFRTPLTLILGPLQQLLEDYKGSNKMYKKLLVIQSSANQLLQLINRLMDFRKLENNQLNLQAAEGNIVKFLREIYFSFSEYAKAGNYTYTFETTDDQILVYYDRAKLERVFYNLISNAFRYTPNGGTITISVSKQEQFLQVEVSDSGIGIAEEYIDKIFDRFFEIPSNTKSRQNYNKGTGIGLSIAKNIVKLHQGSIELKKQIHQGANFVVKLPLGREHLSDNDILTDFKISDDVSQYESQLEKQTAIKAEQLDNLRVEKDKQTILIVEDNEPLRSFLKNFLQHEYNIIEAENGKIAMKLALKHVPDLVISDVIMPEMVGTELCTRIKENIKTCHIPVILLTSRSSLIYKFEGLESGANEYISKPFNLKEFRLRVKNLLETSKRLKQKFSSENYLKPGDLTVTSLDEQLLEKAFKIVEDNISNEQFDIPYFCTELGVSRTLLFTKIKAWTNFTPNEFIHEIRMKRAAQLLELNKINISQVSYKVGFKNPKYFSKCFQKKFGETPSEYQYKFSEHHLD